MIRETNEADQLFGEVDRPVHVNAYYRIRLGHLEFVREHFRSAWGVRK